MKVGGGGPIGTMSDVMWICSLILSRSIWLDTQLVCSSPPKGIEGDICLKVWSEVKKSIPSVGSCTDKSAVTCSWLAFKLLNLGGKFWPHCFDILPVRCATCSIGLLCILLSGVKSAKSSIRVALFCYFGCQKCYVEYSKGCLYFIVTLHRDSHLQVVDSFYILYLIY